MLKDVTLFEETLRPVVLRAPIDPTDVPVCVAGRIIHSHRPHQTHCVEVGLSSQELGPGYIDWHNFANEQVGVAQLVRALVSYLVSQIDPVKHQGNPKVESSSLSTDIFDFLPT